ncbi:MAG: tetratricopeptide repeat protein [Cyanobacteria bacterium J06600_6]
MKTDFEHQSLREKACLTNNQQQAASCLDRHALASCASLESGSFHGGLSVTTEQELKSCIKVKATQGNYAVAIALLDQLIALRPDSATNYNNRGLMHFRNNQIIEALCDLSLALEINPRLDSAYNNRANCYAAQGDFAEAIIDYDLALDLNPSNLRAWINQGITFRELELYELGLENFDIALIIGDALQGRIYAERGRTYFLRGDWNCAVSDYQTALDILGEQSEAISYFCKVQDWLDEVMSPLMMTDD